MKYRLLSPDGFDCEMDGLYTSKKEVKLALDRFIARFKTQGYYSQICYNGYKREIPLESIADYCDIQVI